MVLGSVHLIWPLIKNIMEIYEDKTKLIEERKDDYKKSIDKKMNPIPVDKFNCDNFEPLGDQEMFIIAGRKRIDPPKILPTFGLKPKEIRVGQMIGMFESKQDLYLIMANRINELQKEVDDLKKKIK